MIYPLAHPPALPVRDDTPAPLLPLGLADGADPWPCEELQALARFWYSAPGRGNWQLLASHRQVCPSCRKLHSKIEEKRKNEIPEMPEKPLGLPI